MKDAPTPGPYRRSGRRARLLWRRRLKRQGLVSSLTDADSLHARGELVSSRAVRTARMALLTMAGCVAGAVWLLVTGLQSKDGSYEGAMRAHWSILGAVILLGALNFAWGWYERSRELRETGAKLRARAEYQRKLAALQLKKDKP